MQLNLAKGFKPFVYFFVLLTPVTSAIAVDSRYFEWNIQQSLGVVDSRWREKNSSGVTHVKESGNLPFFATTLTASNPWGDFTLRHERLLGERNYEGVTNQGRAASSVSDVKNDALVFSALKRINSSWAFGMALESVTMKRDIRTTVFAIGYPERYQYALGKLGGEYQLDISSDLRLHTSAWLGRSFNESLLLSLPGFDPVQMKLGQGRTSEVNWRLIKSFPDSKWQGAINLGYHLNQFKAGDAVTLLKSGRIAGSAQQPTWRHGTTQLNVEVSYGF